MSTIRLSFIEQDKNVHVTCIVDSKRFSLEALKIYDKFKSQPLTIYKKPFYSKALPQQHFKTSLNQERSNSKNEHR